MNRKGEDRDFRPSASGPPSCPQLAQAVRMLGLIAFLLVPILHADGGKQDPIAGITTFSTAQLTDMEHVRRKAGATGELYISAEVAKRSMDYTKLLKHGDAAVADQILESYGSDNASRDMAALAFALHRATGYAYGLTVVGDRGLSRKIQKENETNSKVEVEKRGGRTRKKSVGDDEKLASMTLPLVAELAGRKHPHAASAAVELILQVVSESLGGLHLTADNGRRRIQPMPIPLVARAADFLDSDDVFVRAMAEWAISVKVSNDNDRQKKLPWPGKNPPTWFKKWMAVPPSDYLAFDYARQAISLGMHRRSRDLFTLAKDVARRAEEKAKWAGGNAVAVKQMRAAAAKLNGSSDLKSQRSAWVAWRKTIRPVVLESKDIDFKEIVYLKRFSGGHHIQPSIHMNNYPSGGDIYVQDGLEPTSRIRPVIDGQIKKAGHVQDLDLWYDADRIVFSRSDGDRGPQWLYEIGIDGKNLRQLTDDGKHHDVDPAYLPDGSVVFGSSRSLSGVQCGGGGFAQNNIFRITADGKKIIRLSYSADDDAYPSVLNDGRVVYMRWDYQERGVDEIFSLWSVRPDGSGSDGFYRVHIPDSLIIQALKDPQPIPGTQKLVAMGSSHRAGNEGMVALCDLTAGINNPKGIRSVTPYHSAVGRGVGSEMRPVEEGGVPYVGGYYVKPYPLTDKTFLVSAGYDMPQSCNFQAYYIDVWGNKELLHRDKMMEAVAVMPVRKRTKPPIMPDYRDDSKTYATVYVENVYADLPGIKRGEVKYIRLLEQLSWINEGRGPALFQGSFTTSGGTGQGATRIIGIVPVHDDGSAAFQVPSQMPVYFQALDKDFRGIQRMRTHVEFAPGEIRGCVGCHETRANTAMTRPKGKALSKPAVRPTPPPWGDSTFISYQKMIQPLFEKKCVSCHGKTNPKGGIVLTAEKDKKGYMQSYRSLFGIKPGEKIPRSIRKSINPTFDAMAHKVAFFLGETLGEVTKPKQFGSPQAPVATKLVSDPKHRKLLTDDEMRLIMAWLDVRAPYHDAYYKGRNNLVTVEPFPPFGKKREHTVKGN